MNYISVMFRTARRALVAALVAAIVPAAASAAIPPVLTTTTTTTTTSSTTTTVAPKPKPKPKPGTATLQLMDAFSVRGRPVTTSDRGMHIQGIVRPYVPHQVVTLQVWVGHRLIERHRLGIRAWHAGRLGLFTARIVSPSAGTVTISAVHTSSSTQKRFVAGADYAALTPNAGFGSTGRFVELIQERLQALHLFIPQTGVYDLGTGLALDAYHRLLGWGVSQTIGPATVNALLNGVGQFPIRFPRQGHHVEGNLSRQLLAIADGGRVQWIFPISSGKPSTPTILGSFQIYDRVPGYLPDGMYYSSFFSGGYAIHGYDPAPDYPASHGCMRLPITDATFVFSHVTYGNWVDTYF